MSIFFETPHYQAKGLLLVSAHGAKDDHHNGNQPSKDKACCRAKPDLRLAESYIPALLLIVKCIVYCTIAPIVLMMHWRLTLLAVTFFALALYVDHIYLVLPNMLFIDTSALALDVFASTLLVLAMSFARPCTHACQAILGLWSLCSAAHVFLAYNLPKPLIHLLVLCFVMGFMYADMASPQTTHGALLVGTNHSNPSQAAMQSLPFFSRTAFYTSLVLVDIYLFRPLFQQENERLQFCKYGAVLLASWPWCLLFWFLLASVQLARLLTSSSGEPPGSSSSTQPTNVQDMDVMEAFRLAKQQHMGSKGAQ